MKGVRFLEFIMQGSAKIKISTSKINVSYLTYNFMRYRSANRGRVFLNVIFWYNPNLSCTCIRKSKCAPVIFKSFSLSYLYRLSIYKYHDLQPLINDKGTKNQIHFLSFQLDQKNNVQ